MKRIQRKSWENHNREQIAEPLSIWEPENLNDVRAIMMGAFRKNIPVKPVGSGHSFSDVCLTSGYLVRPIRLNKILNIDKQVIKPGINLSRFFKAESGMTVKKLNRMLDNRGLALPNMGGFDAQTIIGATATSTHGSGIKYGPLCDMIRSVEVVANEGEVYRIEPNGGITDPTIFATKYPGIELIQDDDFFYSIIVSLGCLGIIYSVTIEVREAYNLQEVRTLSDWETQKAKLRDRSLLDQHDHSELLLNPYADDQGSFDCLVTTRNPKDDGSDLDPKDKHRNFWVEFGSGSKIVNKVIFDLFNNKPQNAQKLLAGAIKSLEDESFFGKSFEVYNIGNANHIQSYSSEIALPMAGDVYIDAIDHMLSVIQKNADLGQLYHSGPISLRFVKGSPAYLSPQYDRDTCMVEIIMLKNTTGAYEMYDIIEKELRSFGARAHMGQIISETASDLVASYPKLAQWKKVREQLDTKNLLSNKFSERMGL